MTRIKMPANPGRGSEFERGGGVNRRWAVAAPISILLALSFVETACAPGVERQIVIPIQGAQDFGLNKSELAQYNQTKEDFKNASKDKVFDMTTNNLSSTQEIISSDLTRLTRETGVIITPDQVNIDFDQVDPFWINVGADRLSFAPVPVNIQVEGEETSRTLLFMFGKAEGGQWGQVGFFVPDQKPNESGEINADLALDLTENANPEIGGLVIASDRNERFSRKILFTKDKDGKLVLVESFSDPNKPSQAMVLNQNDLFSLADAPNQPQANFTNVSFKMAAPAIATVTPTPGGGEGGTPSGEAPITLPALDPIKIGTESIQPTTIVGYEAFGPKGELLATQDIYGNWIKVDREVAIPMATAEDWTNVNARLGTDFVINADGVIPGVDGVTVNKENGEVTFSFNGKGPERYSIVNVKVQEINGVKRLLVAGYAWNGETKSWEVFNPGFPTENPEAQVGWFNEADVPNGNWLRWDQRAKEDLAIKAGFVKPDGTADVQAFMADIFKNAYVPTEWIVLTNEQSNQDFNYDGKNDLMKFNRLWWKSDRPFPEKNVGGSFIMTHLKKNEVPVQSGLTFSLLINSKTGNKNVLVSTDILNGDATVTTVATMVDLKTFWTERKSDELFERLKAAFGLSKYSSWTEAYMIWPVTYVFPGASGYDLSPELNALGQSQGSEIEGMIHGATISPQISLRAVPGVLFGPNIVLQSLH